MSDDGKRSRWLLAGSMLGMMSVYAGQSMMHRARKGKSKSQARKVSATASRMTRSAGDFISAVGETMLNRMK